MEKLLKKLKNLYTHLLVIRIYGGVVCVGLSILANTTGMITKRIAVVTWRSHISVMSVVGSTRTGNLQGPIGQNTQINM